jgi:uncharacterized protein YdaU (DUF1376 family)
MINLPLPRWRKMKPVVMAFWKLENNRWTQRRLSKERSYIESITSLRRNAGRLGGRPKSLKNNDVAKAKGYANSIANGKQNESPLPYPLKKEKKEKEMNRVWVARDTPEWAAWQQVKKQESVWSPERKQNGWWFKTQWPPSKPTATKEAAE